ncbi:hypothetical protein ES703_02971 [subsurface metagenome]
MVTWGGNEVVTFSRFQRGQRVVTSFSHSGHILSKLMNVMITPIAAGRSLGLLLLLFTISCVIAKRPPAGFSRPFRNRSSFGRFQPMRRANALFTIKAWPRTRIISFPEHSIFRLFLNVALKRSSWSIRIFGNGFSCHHGSAIMLRGSFIQPSMSSSKSIKLTAPFPGRNFQSGPSRK